MKIEHLVNKVTANTGIASIVTVQSTPRKATFRSAHVEPIMKIAVMAQFGGLDYEIIPAQRGGGTLMLIATPRQIAVSAKHSVLDMPMTMFREDNV